MGMVERRMWGHLCPMPCQPQQAEGLGHGRGVVQPSHQSLGPFSVLVGLSVGSAWAVTWSGGSETQASAVNGT